jgi:hypothetical protein
MTLSGSCVACCLHLHADKKCTNLHSMSSCCCFCCFFLSSTPIEVLQNGCMSCVIAHTRMRSTQLHMDPMLNSCCCCCCPCCCCCCCQGLLGGYGPSLVAYTSSIMASMGGFAYPNAKVYAYRCAAAGSKCLVAIKAYVHAACNGSSTLGYSYVVHGSIQVCQMS